MWNVQNYITLIVILNREVSMQIFVESFYTSLVDNEKPISLNCGNYKLADFNLERNRQTFAFSSETSV